MNLKNRLLISFIVALAVLWIAIPRLPVHGTSLEFGFSLLWIAFALLVIGANLYALLRLGRGEQVEKAALNKEQKEAIKRINKHKHSRLHQKQHSRIHSRM